MELYFYNENCGGASTEDFNIPRTFFHGQCYECNLPGSQKKPLKRCAGCLLLAYCSKICQKDHWKKGHKYICKEFPVVNGMNVLHTTRPWKEHIADLRDRAAQFLLPELACNAKLIFSNPRVCHTCHEARHDRLTDCQCSSVSYCSKRCADTDKPHINACRLLGQIALSYSFCYREDLVLVSEIITYPATLWNILRIPRKISLGHKRLTPDDIVTLNVHVIISHPLFYQDYWETFIHLFPKLKRLNLVFIMQASAFKSLANLNFRLGSLTMLRCNNCEAKNRAITYSVQQMLYHMFFSSPQYTKPDVVIVYGNTREMLASDKDNINNKISYRNMIHNKDTVLILTDKTKDLVCQGTKAVNTALPIEQLGPPCKNPFRRLKESSDLSYFICLKRSTTV